MVRSVVNVLLTYLYVFHDLFIIHVILFFVFFLRSSNTIAEANVVFTVCLRSTEVLYCQWSLDERHKRLVSMCLAVFGEELMCGDDEQEDSLHGGIMLKL